MAFKKTKDLCVSVRKYTDREGKEKNQYENVGHIMEDETGAKMIFIKRSFNPAGVPFKEGSDSIIISQFEVKDKAASAQQSAPSSDPAFNTDAPF